MIAGRIASVFGALALAGCSTLPDTSTYVPPPQGSTWTSQLKLSGSYGSGAPRVTTTMSMHRWQDRDVLAFKTPNGAILAKHDGCWIAQLAGAEPLITWDPDVCGQRPYNIGQTHTRPFKATNHRTKRTFDVEGRWTIEAYEAIDVPAGQFHAFRMRYTDNLGNDNLDWTVPELGIFVKSRRTRGANHPQGPGTFESELVSHTIRR